MLKHRGINYDTGMYYSPGELSRKEWNVAGFASDMHTIASELHCTSVNIFGSELDRLSACAKSAAEVGLEVWLQPRLIDAAQEEVLDHLVSTAKIAESLRSEGHQVYLHVGCELTIFLPGIISGETYVQRMNSLSDGRPSGDMTPRLNEYLAKACSRAREVFSGPLTYASGEWEWVDWSLFDVIGVNLYREAANYQGYREHIARLVRSEKPVVITEFGSCTYRGASLEGGESHDVVDYSSDPPKINTTLTRDETAQADEIEELTNMYEQENVAGCFVYAFSEPTNLYNKDPLYNLDTASYSVVRTLPDDSTGFSWRPKEAFDRIASIYGSYF